jgi:ribonuclease BN (tRNA processing enzyme)
MTLSLVTVGTGTVAPSATRGSPAHWVERDGLRILLDCGPGTMHRLASCGLAWEHVTHIALSHFHPDHFGELPALLFALRHATERTEPVLVLGPPGTVQLVRRLADAYGEWLLDPGYPMGVLDVQAGEPFPLGTAEATLDVHRTPHTPESVALAVQTPEGRIVYTGDTGPSDELGRWAEGADLLLAECSLPEGLAVAGHLTPASAGRLARVAAAKHLVLTHFYPQVESADIRAIVAREYAGSVTLAGDGDRFTVG